VKNNNNRLLNLISTLKSLYFADTSFGISTNIRIFLSWDSFIGFPPLHRSNSTTVLSQDAETSFRQAAAKQLACSALMFSQHLDGLLQLPTSGLLHPDVDLGVRCVSKFPHRRKRLTRNFFPQRGSYPPKNSLYQ